ncbi:MAG TPA: hypothetical protein VH186_33025 [Chloroflexia bacterium]|nr:hypothetical protein [Chloroflexia bacterium]
MLERTILVVGYDTDFVNSASTFFEGSSNWFVPANTANVAFTILTAFSVDLIILDMTANHIDALQFLIELRTVASEVPVIVVFKDGKLHISHPQVKAVLGKPDSFEQITSYVDTFFLTQDDANLTLSQFQIC